MSTSQVQYTARSRKRALITVLLLGGPTIITAGVLIAVSGSKFLGFDFVGLPILWAGIYFRM